MVKEEPLTLEAIAMAPFIMIVDDHAALRSSIRNWLGVEFPDAFFMEAESGEEAVSLILEGHRPDIVLMDISLPGMNGIEATRRIRAEWPQARVVMLTIHDTGQHRRGAESAGACGYVLKPAVSVELIPVLKKLPSNPAATKNDVSGPSTRK